MSVSVIAVIAAFVLIAAILVTAASVSAARRRGLRRRFGPEYDRAVAETRSRRQAAAALAARLRRVRDLEIRPLSDAARAVYLRQWTLLQERFVDQPDVAAASASQLIGRVLSDRGYGTDDEDQLLADLSVDHAQAVQDYRSAQRLSQPSADGGPSTEDLRQAMIRYRAVFADLLGGHAESDEPASGGRADGHSGDGRRAEEEQRTTRDVSAQARIW